MKYSRTSYVNSKRSQGGKYATQQQRSGSSKSLVRIKKTSPKAPSKGSPEWKNVDLNAATGDIAYAPAGTATIVASGVDSTGFFVGPGPVAPLTYNAFSQGADSIQRLGRKITVRRIDVNGLVQVTAGGSDVIPDHIKVWIVHDKQSNGALPAVSDVLVGNSPLTLPATTLYPNLDNKQRFTILGEIDLVVNPGTLNATNASAPQMRSFSWSKPMNLTVEYSGQDGRQANVKSDNVFAIAANDSSGNAGSKWTVTLRTRVMFTDA